MIRTKIILLLTLMSAHAVALASNVLTWEIKQDMDTSYEVVKNALEENRFYVVFEPNIHANLEGFSERWGENYNRNKLEGFRAMIFCNGWYANEVSNKDPEMLALCPLHISLIQKNGHTKILFAKPSVIAQGSNALEIATEIENAVVEALDNAVSSLSK